MNKVILMGRLTKDPDVRYSNSAEPVAIARFALAVNRTFKREGQPDADFINCVAFSRNAEFIEKYFKKGQLVSVVGRIQVSTQDDPQTNKRTYYTDVIVEEQYFAESKASSEGRSSAYVSRDDKEAEAIAKYSKPKQAEAASGTTPAPDGFFSLDQGLDDEDLPF
ncbi:single-stranded DNA-binding protein [Clostridia bacterium]|nr:single-stranded DNA-binding protein [Clostridia bacterium]